MPRLPAGGEPRQHRGRDGAADRDRRLPDPEREAALVGREPADHRATARRVDARAERTREREQADEGAEAVRQRERQQREAAARESGRHHRAFADPIGEQPPRQKREEHAERRRAECDARPAE